MYPTIMCFGNFHIQTTGHDRQRTHWHGLATAEGGASASRGAEYVQVEIEAVYLPPDPQDPDEYTATTIKRAQSPSQRHRATAILRLARDLTSARARSGILRHSGNCHHVFFAQSPEAFTYDLDGNLTSDGRFTYTWNAENRLIKAETRNDLPPEVPRHRVTYAYDHQGRMVFKEVFDISNHYPLTTTHYTWDGWNIIAETAIPLTPSSLLPTTSFYVWGLDLSGTPQGAGGVGGLLAVIREDGTFAPCYDASGNVTEYVTLETRNSQLETGAIAAHYQYDSFGNTVAQHGTLADSFAFRFSTKPYCAVLGKIEYELRIYGSPAGRWMSRDPIEEWGGLNLYGFIGNDPLNRWDYLGLQDRNCVLIVVGSLPPPSPPPPSPPTIELPRLPPLRGGEIMEAHDNVEKDAKCCATIIPFWKKDDRFKSLEDCINCLKGEQINHEKQLGIDLRDTTISVITGVAGAIYAYLCTGAKYAGGKEKDMDYKGQCEKEECKEWTTPTRYERNVTEVIFVNPRPVFITERKRLWRCEEPKRE